MLRVAAITGLFVLSAAVSARALISFDQGGQAQALRAAPIAAAQPAADAAPASGQAADVAKAADGHYWADAAVNGQAVRFLVDTGASAVALTVNDARRLGFDPAKLNYRYEVNTASGQARAAEVKLASVSVAGAQVADVDAFVIESGLQTSLLGMTYLGRLSQFEATRTALILRP
jgi:aspartyl protease family protein